MSISSKRLFVNIKIASFNCRGINDELKRAFIFDMFRNSDISIICLQETKLKCEKEFLYKNEWGTTPAFFNSVRGGRSGTAILFNTNQVDIKQSLFDQDGRVIALDVDVDGTMLHVINTYFPNKSNEHYSFICGLHPFFHSSYPIIWAGDHNISTNNKVDRFPSRNGMDRFGGNILEIMDCFDLVDACRLLYPIGNFFTYSCPGTGVKSRIDKLIVSDCFSVKQYHHETCNHSDHVILVSHLQINEVCERGLGVWKNNTSIFRNDTFLGEFEYIWCFWKENVNITCPIVFWTWVKKRIKLFLMEVGKIFSEKKRKLWREEYDNLMQNHQLPNNGSTLTGKKYLVQKKKIAKLELDRVKEKIDMAKCKEFIDGDRPTKCFFQKFNPGGLKSRKIDALIDRDGGEKRELRDMLNIAKNYFEDMFKAIPINESIAEYFLQYVQPILGVNNNVLLEELCRDFTVDELKDAIFSFQNGRSPGPDGLTIEFYKSVFSVIKDDLLAVYNCIKDKEFIPSRMKAGLIVLVPKGEGILAMEKYRGITLNNVDLKILSKMLHYRLSPYLTDCIHSSQYSAPGKREWELNSVLRDIFHEMKNQSVVDSFLVGIDFRKAFDSIITDFLYRVLEKMGLPLKFIALMKAIDVNASAKVIINGAVSKKFKIRRGTRQGDPLSMDKFIIALNPLIIALHSNEMIQKYRSNSNQEFLTLAKADDLTVVVNHLSSLLHIRHVVMRFQLASGLEINFDKTKGLFFNKQNVHSIGRLPFNHWNEDMVILGIPFGQDKFIDEYWKGKYDMFVREANYFQSYKYLTLQAKSIISKSKLMPKISYMGSVLPIPSEIQKKIDNRMLGFVVPHKKTFLTIDNLSARRSLGGIALANINLHCEIMLIRNVMFYMKQRDQGLPLTPGQQYIEYNLGHQISSMWGFSVDNSSPHAFSPNRFYSYVLNFLKKLKELGITKEDMVTCRVKVIYLKSLDKRNGFNVSPNWGRLHTKLLPNYLNSFNYKVHFNLFPVRSKFQEYRLDNESRCPFCNFGFETLFHIMGKCNCLNFLWDFVDEVLGVMGINYSFTRKRKLLQEFEVMTIKPPVREYKLILFLTTVINYHLWKY